MSWQKWLSFMFMHIKELYVQFPFFIAYINCKSKQLTQHCSSLTVATFLSVPDPN